MCIALIQEKKKWVCVVKWKLAQIDKQMKWLVWHLYLNSTPYLVDILQGQTQGFVCGASRGHDGVQRLQQGDPTGMVLLPVQLPAFEPRHLHSTQ